MIEILKNVPIPPKAKRGKNRKHQDLYDVVASWEVGDCVILDYDSQHKNGQPMSRREVSLRHAAIRSNQKTTSRKNTDGKSISVWRIE
jgi:hypothetical protein